MIPKGIRKNGQITTRPRGGDDLFAHLRAQGLRVRVRVTGGSMFPAIRSGDVVTLAPLDPGSARPGDVVLFRDVSDRLVLHRVLETGTRPDGEPWVRTRGDSAAGEDLPVSGDRVLGRTEAVERRPLWIEVLSRARMAARWVMGWKRNG
ncbi:MAG: signal peptidase I [Pseudomonadota bacterium]